MLGVELVGIAGGEHQPAARGDRGVRDGGGRELVAFDGIATGEAGTHRVILGRASSD